MTNQTSKFHGRVAALSIAVALVLVTVSSFASERIVIKAPRLGVLNLVGTEVDALVTDDLKAFTPLFGKAVESRKVPPRCDVLLVYARISDAGKVASSNLGLRAIIRDSGAIVVIVASENSADAYIAGTPTTGYGAANLVMTLDRGGKKFSSFFVRLFTKMFSGTTMPVAWVELAPQMPGMKHADGPETIFAVEAGQITFQSAPAGQARASDQDQQDQQLADGIKSVIQAYARKSLVDARGTETVAAMAAVVGERCQEAAGEFPVRKHTFVPGQRIFSDKVNQLLAGDGRTLDLDAIPAGTVYGQIRDQVDRSKFPVDRFPDLIAIFRGFAGRVGKPEDWGKVPLSLPSESWPRLLPLRVAFDTRAGVDAVLAPIKDDKVRALRVSARALVILLDEADERLDPGVTLTLVLETINGTAKTAPMITAIAAPTAAMREAQHNVIKVGAR